MIFGLTPFTFFHVVITLIAIVSGVLVLLAMLRSRRAETMTAIFLAFTVATSVTGFLFPIHGLTPALVFGIISMVLLALALAARYLFAMRGAWRWIYVVTAVIALYLNCFVLVVQSFQKIGPLHMAAPKGSEPPFAIAQGALLIAFIVLGFLAVRRFHPRPV